MLDLKRYAVRVRIAIPDESDEVHTGSYSQHYYEGVDEADAKRKARMKFGPKYEVVDVFGPFELY